MNICVVITFAMSMLSRHFEPYGIFMNVCVIIFVIVTLLRDF
jgi:hypothetical protein